MTDPIRDRLDEIDTRATSYAADGDLESETLSLTASLRAVLDKLDIAAQSGSSTARAYAWDTRRVIAENLGVTP